MSAFQFIEEKEDLECEMQLMIQGNESKEEAVNAPRLKRTRVIEDDDEEAEMVKTKKRREDQQEKRSRKCTQISAADEMAKTIFDFNNTASCKVCAELMEELATMKSQLEEIKPALASKDQEIADLKSANEVKRAMIKNLRDEITIAQTTKSKEGTCKWEIHKYSMLN